MEITEFGVTLTALLIAQPSFAQGVYEGQIDGEFKGWEGETIYKLRGGYIIQQASYHHHYHYAYAPKVIVYKSSAGLRIKVDGDDDEDVRIVMLKQLATRKGRYLSSNTRTHTP